MDYTDYFGHACRQAGSADCVKSLALFTILGYNRFYYTIKLAKKANL